MSGIRGERGTCPCEGVIETHILILDTVGIQIARGFFLFCFSGIFSLRMVGTKKGEGSWGLLRIKFFLQGRM